MKTSVIAPFEITGQAEDGSIDIPDGTRVRGLFKLIKAPLFARILPVFVNGEQVSSRRVLKNGDMVVFIIPIAGG